MKGLISEKLLWIILELLENILEEIRIHGKINREVNLSNMDPQKIIISIDVKQLEPKINKWYFGMILW